MPFGVRCLSLSGARMASHRVSRTNVKRHHRVWPWVLSIVGLFVAVLVLFGIAGFNVYRQSKEVQAHESRALSMISDFSTKIDDANVQKVKDQLPQIQQETSQASAIANGAWWNIANKIPYFGSNVSTVQGMTNVIDDLMHQSVPQFMDVVTNLQHANLSSTDDGINLRPIIDCQQGMQKANESLQHQVGAYNALPQPNIDIVRSAYAQGSDKLNALATHVDALSSTFRMLPGFLGNGQTRTYAVMSMTTSEMRSSGGLIGSVGELTADNGSVHVGEFKANKDYLPYGIGDHSADMARVFSDEGPLHMSFDIRDTAVFPDTERAALAMQSIWNRTPWGQQKPLSGVIMVDPVFVQEMVAINGSVTLADGATLNGDNTAEYFLNTVYKQYEASQTDAVFGETTGNVIAGMFKSLNLGKLVKIGETMGTMARERHFTMFSFDANLEKEIQAAGFTGDTPNDPQNPSVGVYLTEQNPSKMGWYIRRTSTIEKTRCDVSGATYHVEYTVSNIMKAGDVSNLPAYITGDSPQNRGKGIEKILFYPPAGGRIDNISQLNGAVDAVQKTTMDGKEVYKTVVEVLPEQSVTYSFDVTVSPQAQSALTIDQTPLGWKDTGITVKEPKCSTKVN
ncbi:chemotaxis protein [Bifidobacterium animalis subsp. animalis MCC 0483]|uniref:Chemotaxis protein n=2 Tax=Bifidobacterium animalis TaxID=28025 RepID=A0AB34T9P6_9BIFI|nr:chemotaxis protein [Bifidobacterium animalis subsp. animalis MCC 0483]